MDVNRTYLALDASTWAALSVQVQAALGECWHRHAGRWQPEAVSLHVATRLLGSANAAAQRRMHLPPLVAWLRKQSRTITVFGDDALHAHRLYVSLPVNHGR